LKKKPKSLKDLESRPPCRLCKRVIINAGIERVITRNAKGDILIDGVKDWIFNEELDYCLSAYFP